MKLMMVVLLSMWRLVTFVTDLQGPHLLAPTGSDLSKYGHLNNVFAGYHYDLNFLTIHGRSRFPGLFIWLKDGRKVPVKVPEGCLLLQAGKQVIIWLGTWSFFKLHNMSDVSLLPKQNYNLSRTCKIMDGPKLLPHRPNNIFCQDSFNLSRRLINTKNFAHLIWMKCYGTVGVVDRRWMCCGYAWGGCEWEYHTGYWCFSKSWQKFVEGLLNSEFICPWYVALLFCSKCLCSNASSKCLVQKAMNL